MAVKNGNYLMERILIVDYGMGNLHSVASAIRKLGYDSKISSDKKEILNASHLILPGVGQFAKAISNLKLSGLDETLVEASNSKNVKILGICLGMQILCKSSSEGEVITQGLGLIKTDVIKLDQDKDYKLPHIGFNEVTFDKNSIFKNSEKIVKDFYFVHSYCLRNFAEDKDTVLGYSKYKNEFISFYQKGLLFATQFHPEKSQSNGLNFLKLFFEL